MTKKAKYYDVTNVRDAHPRLRSLEGGHCSPDGPFACYLPQPRLAESSAFFLGTKHRCLDGK
jgi:hypothetical protein